MTNKVDGITLLQMIKDGKIKDNTLIEVSGGFRTHYPYIFIDENKVPYWKNKEGTIKTIVYAIDLLEFEFEIIEEIEKPKEIEELSFKYTNTYGNVSQHKASERDIINKINELSKAANYLLKKEDEK